MNTDFPENEQLPGPPDDAPASAAAEAAESPSASPKSRSGAAIGWLALLLALGALGLSGWQWWQGFQAGRSADSGAAQLSSRLDQLSQDVDTRFAQLASRIAANENGDTDQSIAALQRGMGELQAERSEWQSFQGETSAWSRTMQAAIEGVQARLAGAEARLAALSSRSMNSAAELDLAEIDYVLRLAQERLELFRDMRSADQALAIADQHIAAFDHPMYTGLRREIGAARSRLAELVPLDSAALTLQLDQLQMNVSQLPFTGQDVSVESAAQPLPADAGWWARLRHSLSSLVTVRRTSPVEADALVLADQELVRQRLWLDVEMARLAAMRHDQPAFAAAVQRFSEALDRWFRADDAVTRETAALLQQLQTINVDPDLPDISAPWVALQAIRAAGVSAPPSAATSTPPAAVTQPGRETAAGPATAEPDNAAAAAGDNAADNTADDTVEAAAEAAGQATSQATSQATGEADDDTPDGAGA